MEVKLKVARKEELVRPILLWRQEEQVSTNLFIGQSIIQWENGHNFLI
jgi:hypothetical protein